MFQAFYGGQPLYPEDVTMLQTLLKEHCEERGYEEAGAEACRRGNKAPKWSRRSLVYRQTAHACQPNRCFDLL